MAKNEINKLPEIPESDVQKSIVAYLQMIRWHVWRRNVAVMNVENRHIRCGEPGQSDLWGIMPDGRHFELEVKRKGKYPTVDQLAWLVQTNRIGGSVSFWADNVRQVEAVCYHVMRGAFIRYEGNRGDYDIVYPEDP